MDYPVAEHRSEYLSLLWVVYDEALRRKWLVATQEQIVAQQLHIVLQVLLPLDDIRTRRLASTGIVERLI
jgi:hypothetical protein